MITKYKIFESVNVGEPEKGDYVLCFEDDVDPKHKKWLDFLSNNIGQILSTDTSSLNPHFQRNSFFVVYENIPEKYKNWFRFDVDGVKCRIFKKDEVLYWSKNKEDLEPIISANKYNL